MASWSDAATLTGFESINRGTGIMPTVGNLEKKKHEKRLEIRECRYGENFA